MTKLSRATYAAMYGPTTGDRVRLADTELIIEVEKDFTIPGEEVKFGGGKVIRDGMGQSQMSRASGAMDTVITNALIVDHSGICKADVGLRDGRIAAIGKAGNPDTQDGVTIVIGPGTEIIACEGRILTAGGDRPDNYGNASSSIKFADRADNYSNSSTGIKFADRADNYSNSSTGISNNRTSGSFTQPDTCSACCRADRSRTDTNTGSRSQPAADRKSFIFPQLAATAKPAS